MPKTIPTPKTWGGSIAAYLELGLPSPTSGVSTFDTATFDTATFGPDSIWTDISADWVDTPFTKRAVSRDTAQYTAGTAQFELDNSAWKYSLENPAGPFYGQIRSGIPIRCRMVITFPDGSVGNLALFTGRITVWNDTYPIAGRDATVQLSAVDVFGQFGKFNPIAQTPRGEGELSGTRMHRVLDNAGYTGPRNIDRGTIQLQATTLASNALTELKLIADSEGGRVWVEADGSVMFSGRYGLLENPTSNAPQILFSDADTSTTTSTTTGPTGTFPTGTGPTGTGTVTTSTTTATGVVYSKPVLKSSEDLHRNTIAYARKGGTAQVAADLIARSIDGSIIQDSRTDLLNVDDPSVLALAQRELSLKAPVERRFDGITIQPLVQPDAARITLVLKWLCQLTLWQQAQVTRHPAGASFSIDRYVFVTGVAHHISAPAQWSIDLTFQSATVWGAFSSSLFDLATFDDPTSVFAW